tara:strand:+ start:61 stop:561 length:501 start_codon:yes stop_codon:yes gene_type:complete
MPSDTAPSVASTTTELKDVSPSLLVEEHFRRLLETANTLGKQCRTISDEIRALQKAYKAVEKASKQKKKRPQPPMKPSTDLIKFLKLEKNKLYSRADVMKLVSEYIKTKKLQLPDNKRKFRPDKSLAKFFGLSGADVKDMTFVEINKYISKHLTKVESNDASSKSV